MSNYKSSLDHAQSYFTPQIVFAIVLVDNNNEHFGHLLYTANERYLFNLGNVQLLQFNPLIEIRDIGHVECRVYRNT